MYAPLEPLIDQGPSRWLRLARKELREILRDRRTLLTLALMPLLLYPLLGLGFSYLHGAKTQPESSVTEYRLGFETREDHESFSWLFKRGDDVWTGRQRGDGPLPGPGEDAPANFKPTLENDIDESLRRGEIDLGIRRRKSDKDDGRDRSITYEISYDPDSSTAKEALRVVHGRFLAANLGLLAERMTRAGRELPRPFRLEPKAFPSGLAGRGIPLAVLVPLVLILMTMTGAVYPAIDLTAGERERGTLEMLMATPISRVGLLAAKYVAVLTVAILTALVNLAMMAITFFVFGGRMFARSELGLSLGMIPVVLFLVVLFAAFYAAVLLVVSSFARSFKEAQAYVVPLTLVSLIPGLLALVPELQLSYRLALVPLLNIVLLARDLLSGNGSLGLTLVVIVATVVYGYIALVLASRTFGAEAVLYSDGRSWPISFRRRRAE
jgi:ABC-2 type transport system permease protein/sodium transport system permease protein